MQCVVPKGEESESKGLRRARGAFERVAVTVPAVLTNRSASPATVTPVLIYPAVRAAVAWLESAFGFEERVRKDWGGTTVAPW